MAFWAQRNATECVPYSAIEQFQGVYPNGWRIESGPFSGSFTTLFAAGGIRPDVYVGFAEMRTHRIPLPARRQRRRAGRGMRAYFPRTDLSTRAEARA
jgi:hypothetical protein